ncbi:MAG: hypothetical protein FWE59_05255, partial [Oscillospiraceae bacterium]|nr:hypothetical protein [Oscillospiraceae bacterium]
MGTWILRSATSRRMTIEIEVGAQDDGVGDRWWIAVWAAGCRPRSFDISSGERYNGFDIHGSITFFSGGSDDDDKK